MRRLALIAALLVPGLATAQPEVPDLTAAFAAGERGDWATATALAARGGPVAVDLIEWSRLRDGEGDYAEAVAFLSRRGDWPGLDAIRSLAEETMPPQLSASDRLTFFGGAGPASPEGLIALVAVLDAEGREAEAEAELAAYWIGTRLDEDQEAVLLEAFGDRLAPYHAGRADWLLWRSQDDAAERLLDLLDDDARALTWARIGYIRRSQDLPSRVEGLSDEATESTAFRYARFDWLARRGQNSEAVEMLDVASETADTLGEPFRWSGWRRSLARWEMRNGDPERAYRLAARHFLTDGTSMSDLEFVAGYIALTKLDRPDIAMRHFARLAETTVTPISQGRAWYWIGRAWVELDDQAAARASFRESARHQTSFYGLLSAERLGMALDPSLAGAEPAQSLTEAGLDDDPMVIAGLTLLEAGERGKAVLFFADLGRTLERPQLLALGTYLTGIDEDFFALLLGKAAAQREMVIPAIYFPVHDMAGMNLPVDPALVLSIARRESEFRADAGSSVGALGLMQLMPGTARDVSGWEDIPYSKARLTSDWAYNVRLGSRYLEYLIEEFGDSPALVAAGYNAGPGRPIEWVREFGDPRLGEIDVVDWVEHIPFRETRDYVMRVTETIPAYELRLGAEPGPIHFTTRLVGVRPVEQPTAQPDGSLSTSTPPADRAAFRTVNEQAPATSVRPRLRPVAEPAAAGPAAPQPVAGPSGIRPIARPTGPGG